ncbi:MAG: redoxin domain-containing protein [Planctomycetaceae bacterium]|nr:redoxin domain-containing protein [Planctomycetaceae bacterium]
MKKLYWPLWSAVLLGQFSGCGEPTKPPVAKGSGSPIIRESETTPPPATLVDAPTAENNPLIEESKLAVGQVAPEIIGPDFDGVEFKLSDYRGKVVVLDFWGDW